jgi:hypothetical protein
VSTSTRAEDIAARTPADRDRVVDLVRLAAVVAVVLGHWLVAVVLVRDGELVTGRLLDVVPETQLLTYLFQVMPLFFLVGGAVNLGSWSRAQAQGETWPVWVRRRSRRLLGPLLPLLGLWVPAAVLLGRVGVPEEEVSLATTTAFLPVWFLAVYLLAIALVPITAALHRRFGAWVVAAAIVGTGVVDATIGDTQVPLLDHLNYLLVWAGIHQVGYLWYDDRLPHRPGAALGLVTVGAGGIVVLVAGLGYPLSMIALETNGGDNMDPPTLVLWALTSVQLGVLLAARPRLEGWLRRPRVWAPIVTGGGVIMTVFLWHMTALIVAAALTHPTGLWPGTDRIDAVWWGMRPVWLAVCALVLAGLVAVFQRFEQVRDPVPRHARIRTVAGLVATVGGLFLLLTGGIYTPQEPGDLPLGALGLLLLGIASLGVLRPPAVVGDRS